jgi:hypothetical protein
MDRFTKACLVTIILLLAVIALRPYIRPEVAHAAGARKFEFKVSYQNFTDGPGGPNAATRPELAELGSQGWQAVAWVEGYVLLQRELPAAPPMPNIYK